MLKHVNVIALENQFVKLQAELIILRTKFYMEATASLKEAMVEFQSCRCEDGGLTENAVWMLGIAKHLEDTLNTKGVHEFMNAFEELDYDVWVQFNHEWWSLGLAIESIGEQINKVRKQLVIAKQNCQLRQAFKDAGF